MRFLNVFCEYIGEGVLGTATVDFLERRIFMKKVLKVVLMALAAALVLSVGYVGVSFARGRSPWKKGYSGNRLQ